MCWPRPHSFRRLKWEPINGSGADRYLTADLWVATAAYPNADACYQALEELESEPGAHGACLQGTVVKPKKRGRR
jgi:hypothetical protein